MQGVTSMFYSAGRLYYTVSGKKTLFSRSFSPESGIVTEDRRSYSGVDFSNIAGAFLSGNQLYFASRSDGSLHRVTFAAGSTVTSSNTIVSGPSKDGNDWRARGLFLVAG
jgi:tricorn protease-like protein